MFFVKPLTYNFLYDGNFTSRKDVSARAPNLEFHLTGLGLIFPVRPRLERCPDIYEIHSRENVMNFWWRINEGTA